MDKICYNIACLYSVKGDKNESLRWLKTALDKGYNNWDLIRIDKDLNNIRGLPDYRELVGRKDTTGANVWE